MGQLTEGLGVQVQEVGLILYSTVSSQAQAARGPQSGREGQASRAGGGRPWGREVG